MVKLPCPDLLLLLFPAFDSVTTDLPPSVSPPLCPSPTALPPHLPPLLRFPFSASHYFLLLLIPGPFYLFFFTFYTPAVCSLFLLLLSSYNFFFFLAHLISVLPFSTSYFFPSSSPCFLSLFLPPIYPSHPPLCPPFFILAIFLSPWFQFLLFIFHIPLPHESFLYSSRFPLLLLVSLSPFTVFLVSFHSPPLFFPVSLLCQPPEAFIVSRH